MNTSLGVPALEYRPRSTSLGVPALYQPTNVGLLVLVK